VAPKKNVKLTQGLRPVWWLGVVLAWLLSSNVAAADEIIQIDGLDATIPSDGTGDTPATDLNGWFFSVDPQLPFPTESDPSQPDLSQPWTSAANISTLDYWLSLVMELEDDPSLLTRLYGLGMIGSPDPATPVVSQVSSVSQVNQGGQQLAQDSLSDVPEPVTLALIAGGFALLGLYTVERARRLRDGTTPLAIIDHGPL
jgi:hypothetical protein